MPLVTNGSGMNSKIYDVKVKKLWTTAMAVLLLAACIGGCTDVNVETVGVCPVVISTSPSNLSASVALDQIITVTFNEAMNPFTITPSVFTLSSAGGGRVGGKTKSSDEISGTLTYDSLTHTMSFVPGTKPKSNTTYTGTVGTAIKDFLGNALQTPYVWSFTTGATVSPKVISTDPANNATAVFLNKKVTVTFSAPMDPLTLTPTTFTLKHGSTAVEGTVSDTGTTALFTPSSALLPNTLYTSTITTGAKNLQGVVVANDYVWSFTTGTMIAPIVNSTDPVNLATGVAIDKVISATFSEAMDPSTITTSSFTLSIGEILVSGQVSYSGTTATFTPTVKCSSCTNYTVTITTAAKNLAGIPLANDYVWSFHTDAILSPQAVDLKSVARFGIIAGVGVSNNAGFSEIRNLDVGISPGVRSSITGFPPAILVNGAIYASDDTAPLGIAAMLTQAKQDLTDAYLFAEGATSPAPSSVSGDVGGRTLAPGIYKTTSTLLIQSGDLTLDAQGDANAVWIFQITSDFTTVGGAGGNIILSGGAQAKNVFWQTGSSATIGDGTSFKGNVLALTSITMNSGATAVGRMLARNGSVVLTNTNSIDKP